MIKVIMLCKKKTQCTTAKYVAKKTQEKWLLLLSFTVKGLVKFSYINN